MVALTAKLVESADGQTVQLPQGLRLPGHEVLVRRQGASLPDSPRTRGPRGIGLSCGDPGPSRRLCARLVVTDAVGRRIRARPQSIT